MTDEQHRILDKVKDEKTGRANIHLSTSHYEEEMEWCDAFDTGWELAVNHLKPLIDECNYLCDDHRIKEALKKVFVLT